MWELVGGPVKNYGKIRCRTRVQTRTRRKNTVTHQKSSRVGTFTKFFPKAYKVGTFGRCQVALCPFWGEWHLEWVTSTWEGVCENLSAWLRKPKSRSFRGFLVRLLPKAEPDLLAWCQTEQRCFSIVKSFDFVQKKGPKNTKLFLEATLPHITINKFVVGTLLINTVETFNLKFGRKFWVLANLQHFLVVLY